MKIVLGGSRHLEFIPKPIEQTLDLWVNQGADFLIGDASGSDRAFQRYLLTQNYERVLIFSSSDQVRNNLGNWPSVLVNSGLRSRGSAMHTFKDRKMTQEADTGLMILGLRKRWDTFQCNRFTKTRQRVLYLDCTRF